MGGQLNKVPLDSRIEKIEQFDKYQQITVSLNLEMNERISAYLLVPNNVTKNTPAVYCFHPHGGRWHLGKITQVDGSLGLSHAKDLAEIGYVTFAADAICFGDRQIGDDPERGNKEEYQRRIAMGQTLLLKVLHDISVGIDYLKSIPYVGKIGFIGFSYGGKAAYWAAAMDDRIAVAVSLCGCERIEQARQRGYGVQLDLDLPGFEKSWDVEDIVRLIAPRAFFLGAADEDKHSAGAKVIYDRCKGAFPPGKFEFKFYPGRHKLTDEMRNDAYAFLDRQLRT
jgi:dienelactone hydrolase